FLRPVRVWKLMIFMTASIGLGFLIEAASARIIVLKQTYTKERVHIACINASGESNAGRGPVASDVRRPKAKLNVMLPGSALANADTAEPAKSTASRIFCARVTASRRPALDRGPGRAGNPGSNSNLGLVPLRRFGLGVPVPVVMPQRT